MAIDPVRRRPTHPALPAAVRSLSLTALAAAWVALAVFGQPVALAAQAEGPTRAGWPPRPGHAVQVPGTDPGRRRRRRRRRRWCGCLPPAVLGACRSDLSDLRILDAGGREVPYLVDAGRAPDEAIRVLERRTPSILGASRRTRDPDGAGGGTPALLHESYTLAAPPEAPAGQGWALVLITPRPRFVRALVVDPAAGTGRGNDTTSSPRARSSASPRPRRPSRRRPRERLRIALPETLPAAPDRHPLGEEDTFLEPASATSAAAGSRARTAPGAALRGGRPASGPRARGQAIRGHHRTVLELDRPRAWSPAPSSSTPQRPPSAAGSRSGTKAPALRTSRSARPPSTASPLRPGWTPRSRSARSPSPRPGATACGW